MVQDVDEVAVGEEMFVTWVSRMVRLRVSLRTGEPRARLTTHNGKELRRKIDARRMVGEPFSVSSLSTRQTGARLQT